MESPLSETSSRTEFQGNSETPHHVTTPTRRNNPPKNECVVLSPGDIQKLSETTLRGDTSEQCLQEATLFKASSQFDATTLTFPKNRFHLLPDEELERIQEVLPSGVQALAGYLLVDQTQVLVKASNYSRQELEDYSGFLREELGYTKTALIKVEDTNQIEQMLRRAELRGARRDDSLGIVVRSILPDSLAIGRVSLKFDEEHNQEHIHITYRRPGFPRALERSYEQEVEWELGIPARLHLQPEEWLREQLLTSQPPNSKIESVRFSRGGQREDNLVIAHTIIFSPEKALRTIKPWIHQTERELGIRIDPILKPVSDAYFEFVNKVGNPETGRLERPELLPELLGEAPETDFSAVSVRVNSSKRNRLDLTHQQTIVVDPRDSLDRDDGFSVMRVPGGIQLQVHITDVPALIRLGSEQLDMGLRKAFSVYGASSVDPLHPRRLALEVGSLKQDRVRFTWTFAFTIRDGSLCADLPRRSLVRVSNATSYDDLYDALIRKDHPLAEQAQLLNEFHDQAKAQLEESSMGRRFHGAGDWSHSLIAKNNVLVNEMVANLMYHEYPSTPWLYRAFQPPSLHDEARAEALLRECGMGFLADRPGREHRQRALRFAELTQGPESFSPEIARVIGEAFYTITPTPHVFFNGFYSHFSSPLRRGSDVVLGYQLSHALTGTAPFEDGFVHEYANYLSYQSLLENQRHRELLTKEELTRHEHLLGKSFVGSLAHVSKDCAIVDVPDIGRGIIQRQEGLIEMDRNRQRVTDIQQQKIYERGDRVGIYYETVNLWRFRPILRFPSASPENHDVSA